MSNPLPVIGCAGAGNLGAAIMRRLLDCGHRVLVWNRSPARLAPLVDAGASAVATPAELARGADLIITCVLDGAAVEDSVFGEQGIASAGAANKLLIDMSTINADHSRKLAARLKSQCQMGWLDAPISGGAPAALEGRMAIMVGGAQADYDHAQPVWDALAGRATLMGDNGAGQTTKMINQVLVSCGFAVLAESCGLAERAGVDPSRIATALEGGRADSQLLQEFMSKMGSSDFSPTASVNVLLKDLHMISDLARASGAPMPVTSLVEELNRKMVLDGMGDSDPAELVRMYRSKQGR
jgi:3-hydroxyisobutyrate dehydrogenase-like beta-hydroxyacid dehydrogenase